MYNTALWLESPLGRVSLNDAVFICEAATNISKTALLLILNPTKLNIGFTGYCYLVGIRFMGPAPPSYSWVSDPRTVGIYKFHASPLNTDTVKLLRPDFIGTTDDCRAAQSQQACFFRRQRSAVNLQFIHMASIVNRKVIRSFSHSYIHYTCIIKMVIAVRVPRSIPS